MSSKIHTHLKVASRVLLATGLALVTTWAVGDTKGKADRGRQDSSPWSVLSNGLAYAAEAKDLAYLGVQLAEEVEHPEGGARVVEVIEGSPADEAGMREGDLVQRFDNAVVRGPVSLTEKIHALDPGDSVEIVVLRDGRKTQLQVELGKRPGSPDFLEPRQFRVLPHSAAPVTPRSLFELVRRPRLGIQLVETTPELRRHLGGDEHRGVLVSKVLSGTPAEHAGLLVGDLIVAVEGEPVATSSELVHALRELDGAFTIELIRGHESIELEASFPEPIEEDFPTGPRAFRAPIARPDPPAAASIRTPAAPMAPPPGTFGALPVPAPRSAAAPGVPSPPLAPRRAPTVI